MVPRPRRVFTDLRTFFGHRSRPRATSRQLPIFEQLDQFWQHLVNVSDDPEIGDREDRRVLVLVDRDDVLGPLHADHVLGRPGYSARYVYGRLDRLSGLS